MFVICLYFKIILSNKFLKVLIQPSDWFMSYAISLSHKKLTNYSQIFFSHSIIIDQFLMT